MMDIELFKDINVEKRVLKPFKIGNRSFFTVVEVTIIGNEISFSSLTISPVAFLIEENQNKYVIPLIEDEIDEDEILKLFIAYK
jgi:hypothetical protein